MPKSCLFVGQYGPKVCPTSKPQTGNGLLGYDIVDPTMSHHPVQAALAARLHWKWTLWPRGARDHRECDPVHLLRNWTTRGKAREKRDMSHKTLGAHFRIGLKGYPAPDTSWLGSMTISLLQSFVMNGGYVPTIAYKLIFYFLRLIEIGQESRQ